MTIDNRRIFLKKLGSGLAFTTVSFSGVDSLFANVKPIKRVAFNINKDRVWLGSCFWAIPMEDWKSTKNGRIEFIGEQKSARVNILSHVISQGDGTFTAKVDLGISEKNKGGSAGFRVGIKDVYDADVKAACYYGDGIDAGISSSGFLFIGDKKNALPSGFSFDDAKLQISIIRKGDQSNIELCASSPKSKDFTWYQKFDQDVNGLVALINNYDEKGGDKFWFKNLSFEGSKIQENKKDAFGPILWTMYTLSKRVLKISAQMPPMGNQDNKEVMLYFFKDGNWQEIQTATIEEDSCSAIFKLSNFSANAPVKFKVVYHNDNQKHAYEGLIREEPENKKLKFAGLTCQEGQGYPYSPLTKNLPKHNPDMLFFSGDQIYEQNGGYPIKRFPAKESILSFLGKWYMFGWAFGDVMRNRPTICTPDDHDVFQGNLWGEGGAPIDLDDWNTKFRDAQGGYVQSPRMVNAVHRANCGHMPDAADTQPTPSGITTWYTDLVYGGVSFAIISDRMFKSGPEVVRKGTGRLDHITKPLSAGELEKADLEFLGDKQIKFLENWVMDWKNSEMKVLLSQTLFSNVGTHHGNEKTFLLGDMDSGGWPKKQRDEVVKIIRKGYTFHINGDQHLPFIVQYSTDGIRDGGYTFCTPAISTGYIRWGEPDVEEIPFTDRPAHDLPNTGIYQDIFGNKNYIYAVGNPKDNWRNKNRYIQAQNKSSGFGIVTFNTQERTIKMEAFKFLSDFDKPTSTDQYPGWPHTITQVDNDGRKNLYSLPELVINKNNQVVKILSEKDEVINVLRLTGNTYIPKVAAEGKYLIEVGEGDKIKVYKNQKARTNQNKILRVTV
ncbi:alkaline phosphatase D family protein [Daejeonella sp.]|uniref:alkaline phosphatase D family protein n=1 Tax=Daejeonella sp. TaxID=2805397 RepID=UPI0030BE02F3